MAGTTIADVQDVIIARFQGPEGGGSRNPLLVEAQRTISVIDLLVQLHREHRAPHPSELALLTSWQGWGSLAPAYGRRGGGDARWPEVRAAIERRVKPAHHAAIRAWVDTSYFTNPQIVGAVWRLAEGLGFAGGRVLDIGCGTGAFLAAVPAGVPALFTGVEPDPMAAWIASLRFPEADIIPREIQDAVIPDSRHDIAVGNMPFANPDTADYPRTAGFSLHNYCLFRALRAVRPGGLVVAVTSRFTLDATSPIQRGKLARLGHLVGAIRLPSSTFGAAGTSVVTDIAAFRRHAAGGSGTSAGWRDITDGIVPGIAINEYFSTHPHLILGRPSACMGTYRPTLAVQATEPLPVALNRAISEIVRADAEARS
jgi:SAM-dependent methyltransferase